MNGPDRARETEPSFLDSIRSIQSLIRLAPIIAFLATLAGGCKNTDADLQDCRETTARLRGALLKSGVNPSLVSDGKVNGPDQEPACESGFLQINADGNISDVGDGARDLFETAQSDLFDEMEDAGMEAWDVVNLEDGYEKLPDAVKPFIRIGYTQDENGNVVPIKVANGEALAEVFANNPDILIEMAQAAGLLGADFNPDEIPDDGSDEMLAKLEGIGSLSPAFDRNFDVKKANILSIIVGLVIIALVAAGVVIGVGIDRLFKKREEERKRARITASQFMAADPALRTIWSGNPGQYAIVPDPTPIAGEREVALGRGARRGVTAVLLTPGRRRAARYILYILAATGIGLAGWGVYSHLSWKKLEADAARVVNVPVVPELSTKIQKAFDEATVVEETDDGVVVEEDDQSDYEGLQDR